MTARDELIAKLEKRIPFLMDRINFHTSTRQALIDEAARVQAEIDEIRAGAGEDLERWNYNAADDGQLIDGIHPVVLASIL